MISLKNIGKEFRGKVSNSLFSEVTFSVPNGTCCAIIGENGSGKTTLLRIATGSVLPNSGEVILDTPAVSLTDMERQLHFRLTASENIRYITAIMGGKVSDNNKIETTLKELGIFDKSNQKVGQLSKGQKLRVIFSILLLSNWKSVLLDEPTNGLDEAGRYEFKNIVTKLKSSGCSILLTTHDASFIRSTADSVLQKNKNGQFEFLDLEEFDLIQTYEVRYIDSTCKIMTLEELRNVSQSKLDSIQKLEIGGLYASRKEGNSSEQQQILSNASI